MVYLMCKKLSICMIGFGNAGRAFCKMLLGQQAKIKNAYDYEVIVNTISTRSKGTLYDPEGVDIGRALREIEDFGRFSEDNPQLIQISSQEAIKNSKAQVLIELSTLSIKDGQPAISHIEAAIEKAMHVITANKGPIAWDYKSLKGLADEKGLSLLYETVVLDGAPVFNMVRDNLPGCEVLAFKGIVNSTTNFIMEEMESGSDFDTALKEAQIRGFAESDPSLDIDGWDAVGKTAALINVIMDGSVTPMDIERTGISHITAQDLKDAKAKGGKIKLLCEGYREGNSIKGKVYPGFVSNNDIFSNVDSTTSMLSITTDLMGEICIVERNPEIEQTAYGVFSDMLTLVKRLVKNK